MITCVKCKSKFEIPEHSSGRAEELSCPHCHSRFKVKWTLEVETASEEPKEENVAGTARNVQSTGMKILVAVDGEATQDVMREVLTGAGHEVLLASTGQEALSILEKEHPKVAYLDVALPQVLGFEVCEIIKKSSQLKETKVILVSSIYDKTRYKRAPTSLYGADDYIERHHVQDGLIARLDKLIHPGECPDHSSLTHSPGSSVEIMDRESLSPRLGVRETASKPLTPGVPDPVTSAPEMLLDTLPREAQATPPPPEETSEPQVEDRSPQNPAAAPDLPAEEMPISPPLMTPEIGSELEVMEVLPVPQPTAPVLSPEESAKHEEARRFARLIISDIALYNQKAIEEGIEFGNVEEVLKEEMAEAEKLFRERVSKELSEKTHYLQDALKDLVDRKKKIMNQGKI